MQTLNVILHGINFFDYAMFSCLPELNLLGCCDVYEIVVYCSKQGNTVILAPPAG